jgi:hypothetical protein
MLVQVTKRIYTNVGERQPVSALSATNGIRGVFSQPLAMGQ